MARQTISKVPGYKRPGVSGRARRIIPSAHPRRALVRVAALLLVLVSLHVVAMVVLEGLAVGEAVWLTLTTITTVGYGDFSADTALGRTATVLLLYFGGIWLAFRSAAIYFDYRAEQRERKHRGTWRWNMEGHILVLNVPNQAAEAYLVRLVREFRASRRFRSHRIQIVSPRYAGGLPEPLRELEVVHFCGDAWDPGALEGADADKAHVIVVLASYEHDPVSDARTFDTVDRLVEMGARGRIVAESVDDANRDRLRRAGASIVVRPLRGYPEMIVRALAAPGAERILEDLFTSRGDECWRYDINITGRRWSDVVKSLIECDIGVAIAFRHVESGEIRINPTANTMVDADKLYVLVREGNARPDPDIERILK